MRLLPGRDRKQERLMYCLDTGVQDVSNGKLYYCDYCNKNITQTLRLKCAVCPDFDLCVECFSVGAETTPHKSNHQYMVMDNLSFPLVSQDWNADEEALLVEAIDMYGLGNWSKVAEHVGTKSQSQCVDHYNMAYMNSPCFPLPDLSHIVGMSKEELITMNKVNENKKELPSPGKLIANDATLHSVDSSPKKEELVQDAATLSAVKDRSIGEKKPRDSTGEQASVPELHGFNFKRQEFDIEYDNDAELLLADMEFHETDTDTERELKLKVLRIYSKRLEERKRRKDFILQRNLLYPDPFEKAPLSSDEVAIYQRFKVFARFHSKEEHEELVKNVIEEHRLVKRICELQESRIAGCRTLAEADSFIEQRGKEPEESSQRREESVQACPSSEPCPDNKSLGDVVKVHACLIPASSTAQQVGVLGMFDDWNVDSFPGVDLLSDSEKQLCCSLRILPAHYLSIIRTLLVELGKGTVTKKSDAHNLFKVSPSKIDAIYDMVVPDGPTTS